MNRVRWTYPAARHHCASAEEVWFLSNLGTRDFYAPSSRVPLMIGGGTGGMTLFQTHEARMQGRTFFVDKSHTDG